MFSILEVVLIGLLFMVLGIVVGAYGHYRYANYKFMKYPEFIIEVCQDKIHKREMEEIRHR